MEQLQSQATMAGEGGLEQVNRPGGTQTVLVQHVSVNEGAQAVIGAVQGGKLPRRGDKPKNG
jgi:hypothetical protein